MLGRLEGGKKGCGVQRETYVFAESLSQRSLQNGASSTTVDVREIDHVLKMAIKVFIP